MFELIYQPSSNPYLFEEEKFESQEDLKKRCQQLIESGLTAEDLMIWQDELEISTQSILK